MASYSSGFTLPDEYSYSPPPPPPSSRPFTFSQPAAPSTGGFSAGDDYGGGSSPSFGGGGGAYRAPYSPIAPGSRGLSSTAARGGIPRGYSAYAWGQQLGRAFARKRWKDMMAQGLGPKQFPMPPR